MWYAGYVTDFPLGFGKSNYSLQGNVISLKVHVVFGQLKGISPKMKK